MPIDAIVISAGSRFSLPRLLVLSLGVAPAALAFNRMSGLSSPSALITANAASTSINVRSPLSFHHAPTFSSLLASFAPLARPILSGSIVLFRTSSPLTLERCSRRVFRSTRSPRSVLVSLVSSSRPLRPPPRPRSSVSLDPHFCVGLIRHTPGELTPDVPFSQSPPAASSRLPSRPPTLCRRRPARRPSRRSPSASSRPVTSLSVS